jgi:AAA family ATPase
LKLNNKLLILIGVEKKTASGLEDTGKEAKMEVLQSDRYPFLCNLVENPKIEIIDKELLNSMPESIGSVTRIKKVQFF